MATSTQLAALPIAERDRFLEMRGTFTRSALIALWQSWLRDNGGRP
jgi:hypothetical protein